jgi:hypothetical protein
MSWEKKKKLPLQKREHEYKESEGGEANVIQISPTPTRFQPQCGNNPGIFRKKQKPNKTKRD